MHVVQEPLVRERLLEKVDRACPHGAHHDRHIPKGADHDGGNLSVDPPQLFQQLQAAHARQTHVHHQAAWRISDELIEELLGRAEGPGLQAHGFDQTAQRLPYIRVVIDHEHERSRFH